MWTNVRVRRGNKNITRTSNLPRIMVSIIPRRAVQSWSSLPAPSPDPLVCHPFFPSLSSIPELTSTWSRTVNVVDGFPIFLFVFSRAVSVSSIDGRHKRKTTISFNVVGYLFSNDLSPCRHPPPSPFFPSIARDDPSFYFHGFTSRIKIPRLRWTDTTIARRDELLSV